MCWGFSADTCRAVDLSLHGESEREEKVKGLMQDISSLLFSILLGAFTPLFLLSCLWCTAIICAHGKLHNVRTAAFRKTCHK